eukprot:scaffold90312_cov35-Tisochrysis_lutea.AAC.1
MHTATYDSGLERHAATALDAAVRKACLASSPRTAEVWTTRDGSPGSLQMGSSATPASARRAPSVRLPARGNNVLGDENARARGRTSSRVTAR